VVRQQTSEIVDAIDMIIEISADAAQCTTSLNSAATEHTRVVGSIRRDLDRLIRDQDTVPDGRNPGSPSWDR
jgi:hypothetical protein